MIEAVASDHLGLRVASGQVDYVLRRLYNERTNKGLLVHERLVDSQQQVNRCRDAAEMFFGDLDQWCQLRPAGFNGRIDQPKIVANRLSNELDALAQKIKRHADGVSDEAKRQDFVAACDRVAGLAERIECWRRQEESDLVYWIERTQSRRSIPRTTLSAAPVDVGGALREHLFQQTKSVIMTSATLATGQEANFNFFKSRIGMTRAKELRVGSPFDFKRQAELILVRGMPDPNQDRDGFERLCVAMIQRYVQRTDGRAFALFTSYDMMRRVASGLTHWLSENDMALFSQADGLPRHQMLQQFKANPRSLLLGTDSFLARGGCARRGAEERHHHEAAVQRSQSAAAGSTHGADQGVRWQSFSRLSTARGHHQAATRLWPIDSHSPGLGDCRDS